MAHCGLHSYTSQVLHLQPIGGFSLFLTSSTGSKEIWLVNFECDSQGSANNPPSLFLLLRLLKGPLLLKCLLWILSQINMWNKSNDFKKHSIWHVRKYIFNAALKLHSMCCVKYQQNTEYIQSVAQKSFCKIYAPIIAEMSQWQSWTLHGKLFKSKRFRCKSVTSIMFFCSSFSGWKTYQPESPALNYLCSANTPVRQWRCAVR